MDTTGPDGQPSLQDVLAGTAEDLEAGAGLVHLVRLPAREGTSVPAEPPLPAVLEGRLRAMGITGLRTHQAEALESVRRGKHTIVSTGTASGKSLCFNPPAFERILSDGR